MFTKIWWEEALRRVVRSIAQAIVFSSGTDATGLMELDWREAIVILIGWPLLTFAQFILQTPAETKRAIEEAKIDPNP